MKLIDHAKEGLLNLYFFKLRSILALLGVLVGSASVVAMVLGGEIATNEALKQFKSLGTDLLAVSINTTDEKSPSIGGLTDNLSLQQAFNLISIDHTILQIAPYTQVFHPIYYHSHALQGTILGVTDSFANIVNIKLMSGRFVSLLDKYARYCVVGQGLYHKMKLTSQQEPLGQTIQIGKSLFIIIGVMSSWQENSFIYANIDEAVLVPLMASMTISEYATIRHLIIKLKPNANISLLENKIRSRINAILPDKQLSFRSAKELIATMEKQSRIFKVFLGLIGSVSLIVGGIGVMNIMLVSVVERRREIGIRLAVGATRYDIGALFLMEAVMLSLMGGLLGVLLGILIAYIMTLIWHWQFSLFLWPVFAGFAVSVFVGIFFGFYPAYLASKLDPIEALRSD